jgi:deoxyribodipyrimidine photolyase-related protein
MPKTLRLILGDQLHSQHSWFHQADDSVTYLMMEMRQETDYVDHHIQKVVGFFLAMRTFAEELKKSGHQVLYITLDHPANLQNLKDQLEWLISTAGFDRFEYQLPDEYRLDRILKAICEKLPIPTHAFDTEHFLTSREFLGDFFSQKKTYLMETFYREMRKKYRILMDGKEPLTGQWNYDHDNRAALKDKKLLKKALIQPKDVREIVSLLEKSGVKTIGRIDSERFPWPVSRAESLEILNYFCENLLVHFGAYQDALTTWDAYLFHSRLSFSLNTKMISPLEVVQTVEKYWFNHQDRIHIAQVEGFIRQIIGWREYMRGIYWAKMPDFGELNFFGHDRKLPEWFWTGKTKMNCLSQAIGQSLDLAYAHHIQRLMVTGNFALLAGIHPDEVDRWYLGIYIDAIEWVEITNTRGMSQFADGGIVGTKPYVSSANYIKKQGNYCDSCAYDSSKKTGHGACPFNSLYWHFYARNQDKLEKNPRIGMAYKTWDKMGNKQEILDQAAYYLENLDAL